MFPRRKGCFLHLKSLESYLQIQHEINDSATKIKHRKLKTGKVEVSLKTSVWLLGTATSYSFNYILSYYTFYRILHYPVHCTCWISKHEMYIYTWYYASTQLKMLSRASCKGTLTSPHFTWGKTGRTLAGNTGQFSHRRCLSSLRLNIGLLHRAAWLLPLPITMGAGEMGRG